MALLTYGFDPRASAGFASEAAQIAGLLQRQHAQAQQTLDEQAKVAAALAAERERTNQALLQASLASMRRDFEFKKQEEYKERESLRDYDIASRKVAVAERGAAPYPLISETTSPAAAAVSATQGMNFGAGGSRGFSAGVSGSPADETTGAGLGGILAGHEPAFSAAASRHGIDPTLLKAIAAHETGGGTSRALRDYNNPGGLMRPDNPQEFQKFATVDEGIDAMASLLRRNYLGKGLTTPEAIGAKYAPPGAENDPRGLNSGWASGVKVWMGRLGGSETQPIAAPAPATPDFRSRVLALQKAGFQPSVDAVNRGLEADLVAGAYASARAQTKALSAPPGSEMASTIAKWPVDEQGNHYNPEHPQEKFKVNYSSKGGIRVMQQKTDGSGPNLTPIGDRLYEDANGAQFYVSKIVRGQPQYERAENDYEVKARFTESNGRVHSYNQFGVEVAVTEPGISGIRPTTKPMVGTDGNLYGATAQPDGSIKIMPPPPPGVKFDNGKSEQVRVTKVGSDGKLYGFRNDGTPVNPIPDGVTFFPPKDPKAAAEWRINQKTGNQEVFNFRGEKIAENEGDFARLANHMAAIQKSASASMSKQYADMQLPVHQLWAVQQEIINAGGEPNASHEELVAKLGPKGRALSKARGDAEEKLGRIKNAEQHLLGRDFAENFVRDYEAKYDVLGQPKQAAQEAPAAAPTTAAPVSDKPKQVRQNGVLYTLQPDGSYK